MANDPSNSEPSAHPPLSVSAPQSVHPGSTSESELASERADRRAAVAVPADVEYHRVYAGRKSGIGRGIAALVLLIGGLLVFGTAIAFAGAGIDSALGNDSALFGGSEYTPIMHASTLLGIAVILPWSMLIQRWLYRYPAASLHSVLSVFRWALFGRTLAVVLPLWAIGLSIVTALEPAVTIVWEPADLIALFVITILLTPLQAAAEEYGFRGLAFRVGGSWGRNARSALVLGVTLSSVLFMLSHLALDPWLNLYYLVFGVTLCLITWRTGGLEVAVVVHAVNNTLAFLIALVLWSDFLAGWDRSVGAGSPVVLLLCLMLVGATVIAWWSTRRSGPERTPSINST